MRSPMELAEEIDLLAEPELAELRAAYRAAKDRWKPWLLPLSFLSGCLIMLCVYQGICWGVDAWEPDGAIPAGRAFVLRTEPVPVSAVPASIGIAGDAG